MDVMPGEVIGLRKVSEFLDERGGVGGKRPQPLLNLGEI